MKLVTAVIKPHMIEPVTSALHATDVEGITITEVRGHGRQRGHTEVFRGAEYKVDYPPKIRVEIVTDDDEAEKDHPAPGRHVLRRHSRPGAVGDPVHPQPRSEQAVRRTDNGSGEGDQQQRERHGLHERERVRAQREVPVDPGRHRAEAGRRAQHLRHGEVLEGEHEHQHRRRGE